MTPIGKYIVINKIKEEKKTKKDFVTGKEVKE